MPLADLAWAGAYGLCLFAGRWLMVAALQLLPAYAVTPLMNFQFVWMVLLGAVAFGEWPAAGTFFGALAVACSGAFLVWEQKAAGRAGQPQSGSASRILSRPLARAPR
jgi:S-adenosylmethionine uptake transporter